MKIVHCVWFLLLISSPKILGAPKTSDDEIDYSVEDYEYEDGEEMTGESGRSGRLLLPIFSMMKQSPAVNYRPYSTSDMFDFLRDQYPPPSVPLREYDFVIVGAGSAGCVLASRLSEIKNWTVLLLEAGTAEMPSVTDVPVTTAYLQGTDYNWGYKQEKQPGLCMAMEDQKCAWPRGKALGGSSVINYMIYTRGNKLDWDRIAAAGNPGWSHDEVIPYFMKSEGANLRGLEGSKYHNRNGLMSIEYPNYRTVYVDAFINAAKELGNEILDYNLGFKSGFGYVQSHTRNGRRHSAARAFLHPFKDRPNLHILQRTRVTKISIKAATQTATAVHYIRNRLRYKVKARKEIIISAGALSSPQLLMLSGIGPKEHLQELGIKVIKDLRVGQTMYDHLAFSGLAFLTNITGASISEDNILTLSNFKRWNLDGQGPMSVIGGVEGIGYIKTKASDEQVDHPDVEMLFAAGGVASDRSGALRQGMNVAQWFFNDVYAEIIGKDFWTILPMLLHPKSKGYIKLKDKNPFHWPKFYYDYFSDETDLNAMVEGIKYAIKLSETKAFQKFNSTLHKKHFPTCLHEAFGTDAYWKCAARSMSTTLHHQISTCRMGPASDHDAVVDHELKVHGIKRLRIADTSVIPNAIGAHTHAPTVMIGEKLADMLKDYWL